MENRDDDGFDVSDNDFQEKSVADRRIASDVSYDTTNAYVEPAIGFLERVNTYLDGDMRESQIRAERILRDYSQPDGFSTGKVDAKEAVRLLEMEVEQARELNELSGELDEVVEELEEAYDIVQRVYDEVNERNILAAGSI